MLEVMVLCYLTRLLDGEEAETQLRVPRDIEVPITSVGDPAGPVEERAESVGPVEMPEVKELLAYLLQEAPIWRF